MKKKLFTFLTLLLCVASGAWADPTYKSDFTDGQVIWTTAANVDAAITAGWMKMNSTLSKKDLKGKKLMDPATNAEAATAQYSNSEYFYVQKTFNSKASSDKSLYLYVSGLSSISFYFYQNSDGDGTRVMTAYDGESEDATSLGSAAVPSGVRIAYFSVTLDGSDKIIRLSANNELLLTAIKVNVAPKAPKITTQPVGASYVTGATIAPLTVAATASAGTLSYQWYSCDDAKKTNKTAIDGETSASYTPTAAGFYYVTVTDTNGSVDSDVVEIAISAATAPTISVSGTPANAVVVGTEVILTAEATGNPTPTIAWYDNTDAEVGTGATYTVPTDAAGSFSFYAVASNGVDPDAISALQTIVVKEQVATPTFTPNVAYFETSQEVTLACTTTGATIQYSTDNGTTWANYTAALTFTETTTVQAKAVKDGYIDSEVATATFNKVTLDAWTNVTGAATWDWTKFGTKEIKLTDTTTPKKTDEFVLSNIVKYGYCSSIDSNFGNAQALKVTTEYVVRDTKFFQGGKIVFNTTVPGNVEVKYTNTGNRTSEDDRRFLNVNGTNYGEGTMSSKEEDMVTTSVPVAIGEVTIKGTLKKDGSDQYLRIYKIVFTPVTETTVSVGEKLYRTFASKYPTTWGGISGLTAYKATVTGDNVTFEEVTGSVPAGEGLLLKATAADTYTVPVSSSLPDDIDNALVGVTKETTVDGAGIFVLYADDTHPIGFYKTGAAFTVSANTAYLPADVVPNEARTFIALDEEATGIAEMEAVKNVENAKFYNLAGQRVAMPTKGMYIVNGKKVIMK